MADLFPRTEVAGVSLSRMLIGTNWILGYSHRTPAADCMIKRRNGEAKAIADILETFLNQGVDSIMGLFGPNPQLMAAVKEAEDRTGKGLILIDTPIIDVSDTPEGRKAAEATIAESKANGATFCLPHHSSVEQLVRKDSRTIERLPDYLSMVRDHGMIPGLSAHMPELIVYSDLNEYDVQTYVQIYNCMGFLMQVEVEYIHKVIWNAKKPVMTIKSMAAGRATPFVGLTFSWNTLRPCDMVTVGCLTAEEAAEDIEISRAAFEHRPPRMAGRNSPKKTTIMKD
jgi:hypothetical protein